MSASSESACRVDAGTSRSGIGNEMKRIPAASATAASATAPSWTKSSCAASSFSGRETTAPGPALRQAVTSSCSQSPPRGRAATARRPCQGPGIQNRSDFMTLSPLSSRAEAGRRPRRVRKGRIAGDGHPGRFRPCEPLANRAGRERARRSIRLWGDGERRRA